MAIVEKEFSLDIVPGYKPPIIHVSEYDVGRSYSVALLNDGENFTIPAGTTASIEGTIEDYIFYTSKHVKGVFREDNVSIVNNKIVFDLTEEMTAFSGTVWCKVKLTLNDKPISTCGFVLEVDRAGANAEAISKVSGFTEQLAAATYRWIEDNEPALVSGPVTDYLNSQDPQTVVVSAILLAAHPVGSYYWSSESTSPATLFGGTWTRVSGVFVYAADSDGQVGTTGGEVSHTLTIDEMPSHEHDGLRYGSNQVSGNMSLNGGSTGYQLQFLGDHGNGVKELHANAAGGGLPHNNMPPYVAAYCWRRTA